MEKRLTRSDYIFLFAFIFMLVAAVGAFFYGVQVGKQQMQARYEELLAVDKTVKKEPSAYEQQVLVSFYHTIYSPFREFQNKWSTEMDTIATPNAAGDIKSLLKGLKRLADEKYGQLERISIPQNSPLLQDAQTGYLKSLRLFASGADRLLASAGDKEGAKFVDAANKDSYIKEAVQFALKSQQQYFDAIVKWNETIDPSLIAADLGDGVSFAEWSKLNLNEKNRFMAKWMLNNYIFADFYPQDLSTDTDEMIAKGSAKKLRLTAVGDVADTLVNSGAVRKGDYKSHKAKYYSNELLPQLPFFFE